ncbi:MAG: ATP-dependent RecD-like DNA helicase [Erysipelotrichaceae bacterium]|nr:ATP-dependent RecD-like DNA helicase [Erysipelotrichaceae bacterium]
MEIRGRFAKIIYRGNNSYTVAVFEMEDDEVTVTGYLPEMNPDNEYRLTGEYVEHYRYGMQFNIEAFEKIQITDTDKLIKYFSGPEFKGIGPKNAETLVKALGPEAISLIKEDPAILDEIKGFTPRKKDAIIAGLQQDREEKYYFLTSNHLSMKNIMRLENYYGTNMMKIIRENPYQMVRDVDGIGFATADKFAQSIGIPLDDVNRLAALAENILLEECIKRGDSYLEYQEYYELLERNEDVSLIDIDQVISELFRDNRIAIDDGKVYHITQSMAENYIASYLSLFPAVPFEEVDSDRIHQQIREIEKEFGIEYQDKQKEAIEAFFENDIMILTGGPGTGKTTIVRGMVKLCQYLYPQYHVTLCAPTGRSSKRLAELTESEASTIHSLLRWDKETGKFAKNEEDPLNVELLIIDEFSMVDQWLFYNLLLAGANIRKLILIGDQDQLPSVGIGSVLKDLLDSELFKVVRLEKIYRQREGSDIIELAHDIRNDQCTEVNVLHDIRFLECDPANVRNLTLQVVNAALNKYETLEEGFMKVQVLAPKYQGVNGIHSLNNALQKEFNPPAKNKRELQVGYRTFREGDKILQLKNQPDDDVFNGDIGILEEIIYAREDINNQNRIIVNFDGIIVEYTSDTFINITHAYCISVHKAQGSEYPIVIMPIVNEYGIMLQKRLIYTAVTRANVNLIIIGQKEAFFRGIHRITHYERKTTLKDKLLAENWWK